MQIEDTKWSQERGQAWAEDSVAWLKKHTPRATFLAAAGLDDEISIHIHFVAAAQSSTGGLSWTFLKDDWLRN